MVAESGVSGTTAVTTPRSCRDELSGLTSERKSSGARGVVKTDATRLNGLILLILQFRSRRALRAAGGTYDVDQKTISV